MILKTGSKFSGLKQAHKILKKGLQSKSNIKISENRTGEIVKYTADISRAKKVLNFKPKISIQEGVTLSLKHYEKFTDY